MQVRIIHDVTVDTHVEVTLDDVLSEFSERLEEATEKIETVDQNSRDFLRTVDFVTKLIARIPSKAIGFCTDSQRIEVVKRLQHEAARWDKIVVSAE